MDREPARKEREQEEEEEEQEGERERGERKGSPKKESEREGGREKERGVKEQTLHVAVVGVSWLWRGTNSQVRQTLGPYASVLNGKPSATSGSSISVFFL